MEYYPGVNPNGHRVSCEQKTLGATYLFNESNVVAPTHPSIGLIGNYHVEMGQLKVETLNNNLKLTITWQYFYRYYISESCGIRWFVEMGSSIERMTEVPHPSPGPSIRPSNSIVQNFWILFLIRFPGVDDGRKSEAQVAGPDHTFSVSGFSDNLPWYPDSTGKYPDNLDFTLILTLIILILPGEYPEKSW